MRLSLRRLPDKRLRTASPFKELRHDVTRVHKQLS